MQKEKYFILAALVTKMYYEMLISLRSYYLNFEILVDVKWNHHGGTLKKYLSFSGFRRACFRSKTLSVKFRNRKDNNKKCKAYLLQSIYMVHIICDVFQP